MVYPLYRLLKLTVACRKRMALADGISLHPGPRTDSAGLRLPGLPSILNETDCPATRTKAATSPSSSLHVAV